MPKRIPVIVISGFLGSGKTTFLRYLLKESDKKIGLLINEFGDVGIDGDLLKNCNQCRDNNEKSIIELNNGCLCCTVQDDFIPSVQALLNFNPEIEMIFIETSGLALPVPLLQALNWPEIRTLIYLDLVIGFVNGESMIKGLPINDLFAIDNQYKDTKIIDHFTSVEELFKNQLEVSDIVLISRSDLITSKEFDLIKDTIKDKLNNNVPILKSFNGETNLGFILETSIKKNRYQGFLTSNHDHTHAQIFSHFINSDYFLEKKQFEVEMSQILNDIEILRIKGRVWIPNKNIPLQVQIVGKKINTWFEKTPLNDLTQKKKGGMELILIGFENQYFKILESKIKEKFNILNVSK
tara:strand:- start:5780 stop:6835 length:1056 start_codon:yes stop_codon:yes gene_type:complete